MRSNLEVANSSTGGGMKDPRALAAFCDHGVSDHLAIDSRVPAAAICDSRHWEASGGLHKARAIHSGEGW